MTSSDGQLIPLIIGSGEMDIGMNSLSGATIELKSIMENPYFAYFP